MNLYEWLHKQWMENPKRFLSAIAQIRGLKLEPKPEPRPKQPSARRLALAARARLCGLSLTEERGVWALTRPIDEGRVAVNYFPTLKDVEVALETAEQVDGPDRRNS